MFICEKKREQREVDLLDFETQDMRRFKIEQIYGDHTIDPQDVLKAHLNRKRPTLIQNSQIYRKSQAVADHNHLLPHKNQIVIASNTEGLFKNQKWKGSTVSMSRSASSASSSSDLTSIASDQILREDSPQKATRILPLIVLHESTIISHDQAKPEQPQNALLLTTSVGPAKEFIKRN